MEKSLRLPPSRQITCLVCRSTRYTDDVFRDEMRRLRSGPGHRSIELMWK